MASVTSNPSSLSADGTHLLPGAAQAKNSMASLPGITQLTATSLEAFRRDLPGLLQSHAGEWVAYAGDVCLGFHASQRQLYLECYRNGYERGQFLVCSVEPELPEEIEEPSDV